MVCIDERDENGALLHGVDDLDCRGLDRKHHIGVGDQLLAVGDEGDILECSVGQFDGVSGARLHVQLRAELDQLGNDRRHQSHAPFVRLCFLQNGDIDVHEGSSSWPILGGDAQWPSWRRMSGDEEFQGEGNASSLVPPRLAPTLGTAIDWPTPALRPRRSEPASCSRIPGCPCRRARARNRSS